MRYSVCCSVSYRTSALRLNFLASEIGVSSGGKSPRKEGRHLNPRSAPLALSSAMVLILGACAEEAGFRAQTCSAGAPTSYALSELKDSTVASLLLRNEIGPLQPSFGFITDIAVDSAGRTFVADAMNSAVRVFDPAGDAIGSLGGGGEGPGEFRALNGVTAHSDTISMFDPSLWRLTQFSAGGDSVNIFSPPQLLQSGQIPEVHLAGPAVYYLAFPNFAQEIMNAMSSGRRAALRTSTEIVRWQAGKEEWETLLQVPGIEVVIVSGSGPRDLPWGRRPLWDVGADGTFWYADSGTPHFTRYDSSGEKLCEFRINAPEIELSDAQRREFYDAVNATTDDENRLRQLRAQRENIPLPDTKPVLDRLMVSAEGNLWVHFTSEKENAPQQRWYVFDSEGRYEGSYAMPVDLDLKAVTAGAIYGISRDPLDRQSVKILIQ